MGFGEDTDELEQARKVAEAFGTDHKEAVMRSGLLNELPKMVWFMDTPKRNLWPYHISELASKYNKVMLNGSGGDEFLGGYDYRYKNFVNIEKIKNSVSEKIQSQIINHAKKLIDIQTEYGDIEQDNSLEYLESLYFMNDRTSLYLLYNSIDRCYSKEALKKIYAQKLLEKNSFNLKRMYSLYFNQNLHLFDQIMLSDLNFKLSFDFLPLGDALCMAHSVEDRLPFLDNKYVDFAINIPWSIKFKEMQGKYLLRKLMKDKLPREILTKNKQGFAPNTYNIYVKELKDISQSILPNGNLIKEGYFNKDYIMNILNRKPHPSLLSHYNLVWKLVGLELWHKIYIDSDKIKEPGNIEKFI